MKISLFFLTHSFSQSYALLLLIAQLGNHNVYYLFAFYYLLGIYIRNFAKLLFKSFCFSTKFLLLLLFVINVPLSLSFT